MPTLSELFEAVRPSVLYHGTDPDNCASILEFNMINGHTSHKAFKQRTVADVTKPVEMGFRPKDIDKYENVNGVSLTRDPSFARRWKSGAGMVIVLDGEKLRRDYRLIPYDYYGNRVEAEEFLVGDLKNVSKYLLSIECSATTAQDMAEDDELYDPGEGRYSLILAHPLFRVNGHQWDARSGRISRAA